MAKNNGIWIREDNHQVYEFPVLEEALFEPSYDPQTNEVIAGSIMHIESETISWLKLILSKPPETTLDIIDIDELFLTTLTLETLLIQTLENFPGYVWIDSRTKKLVVLNNIDYLNAKNITQSTPTSISFLIADTQVSLLCLPQNEFVKQGHYTWVYKNTGIIVNGLELLTMDSNSVLIDKQKIAIESIHPREQIFRTNNVWVYLNTNKVITDLSILTTLNDIYRTSTTTLCACYFIAAKKVMVENISQRELKNRSPCPSTNEEQPITVINQTFVPRPFVNDKTAWVYKNTSFIVTESTLIADNDNYYALIVNAYIPVEEISHYDLRIREKKVWVLYKTDQLFTDNIALTTFTLIQTYNDNRFVGKVSIDGKTITLENISKQLLGQRKRIWISPVTGEPYTGDVKLTEQDTTHCDEWGNITRAILRRDGKEIYLKSVTTMHFKTGAPENLIWVFQHTTNVVPRNILKKIQYSSYDPTICYIENGKYISIETISNAILKTRLTFQAKEFQSSLKSSTIAEIKKPSDETNFAVNLENTNSNTFSNIFQNSSTFFANSISSPSSKTTPEQHTSRKRDISQVSVDNNAPSKKTKVDSQQFFESLEEVSSPDLNEILNSTLGTP